MQIHICILNNMTVMTIMTVQYFKQIKNKKNKSKRPVHVNIHEYIKNY